MSTTQYPHFVTGNNANHHFHSCSLSNKDISNKNFLKKGHNSGTTGLGLTQEGHAHLLFKGIMCSKFHLDDLETMEEKTLTTDWTARLSDDCMVLISHLFHLVEV